MIMLCRSEQKANAAINSINDEVGDSNGTLTFEQCDMSSMLSVKKCAERHGCQMAIARFLDRICFALRASGLWLRYAALQYMFPSFPWIAPHASHTGTIQGKEGIKFCSAE